MPSFGPLYQSWSGSKGLVSYGTRSGIVLPLPLFHWTRFNGDRTSASGLLRGDDVITPHDEERLRNLLAYPLLTPAEKLVWIAIDLCPIHIENGDYCKVSRADKGRLMMMTSLSLTTIERALVHFDINYFSEHYVRQAILIVEKEHEA